MFDHSDVFSNPEDHPQGTVDGRCNRIEDEKHYDFWGCHPRTHVVLQANCHEVEDVQDRGSVVRNNHYRSFSHKSSEEKVLNFGIK